MHEHRFSRCRTFVQQRSIRDLHTRQVNDHGLEIQQALQPALRDLGLIGRVLRVPARILEQVTPDNGRRDRAVIAHADEITGHRVQGRRFFQLLQIIELGNGRRQIQRFFQANIIRNGLRDELVQRLDVQHLQQGLGISLAGAYMPMHEAIGMRKLTHEK